MYTILGEASCTLQTLCLTSERMLDTALIGYRVKLQSLVTELSYRVKFRSLVRVWLATELSYRVWLATELSYRVKVEFCYKVKLQHLWRSVHTSLKHQLYLYIFTY